MPNIETLLFAGYRRSELSPFNLDIPSFGSKSEKRHFTLKGMLRRLPDDGFLLSQISSVVLDTQKASRQAAAARQSRVAQVRFHHIWRCPSGAISSHRLILLVNPCKLL